MRHRSDDAGSPTIRRRRSQRKRVLCAAVSEVGTTDAVVVGSKVTEVGPRAADCDRRELAAVAPQQGHRPQLRKTFVDEAQPTILQIRDVYITSAAIARLEGR